jgi:DnaK suppressor protein
MQGDAGRRRRAVSATRGDGTHYPDQAARRSAMENAVEIDLARIKKRLASRRNEIRALLTAGDGEARPIDIDQQSVGFLSRMDAIQVQAMAEETARRRDLEIRRIDLALSRISAGEYGWCTSCGEAIALKRLENDPATPLCIDCATRAT